MTKEQLKERTMQFAIRVLKLTDSLPKSIAGRTAANQIGRSACSAAANYRAALRGKSRADFVNKITMVLEETDETAFWIQLIEGAALLPANRLSAIHGEAIELTKIFNATRTTARSHK